MGFFILQLIEEMETQTENQVVKIYSLFGEFLGITSILNNRIIKPSWLSHGVFIAKSKCREKIIINNLE